MKSVFRVDPRTLLKRREEPCLDVVLIVRLITILLLLQSYWIATDCYRAPYGWL
jgi:hypothetical protein